MAILKFPPIENANENGLLAVGGDLEVESLLLAYRNGIFPWPYSDYHPIAWYSPNPRGILEYKDLHISTSFKNFLKKCPFSVRYNTDFEQVILECATSPHRETKNGEISSTWITRKMIEAYIDFHRAGYAFSVETYEGDELVGGLYGVRIKNFVCGESMFYKKTNASKLALYSLMEKLNSEGITWLDTQMVSPIVSNFGGKEITRNEFLEKLKRSLTP